MNLDVRAWLLGVVVVCHPKAHDAVLRGCLGRVWEPIKLEHTRTCAKTCKKTFEWTCDKTTFKSKSA
ncbi:MAG: hypothetical protein ACKVPZ_01515 [Burkholderiaceae bacterium]